MGDHQFSCSPAHSREFDHHPVGASNTLRRPCPCDATIPSLVAAQAKMRPGCIALRQNGCFLTYGELDSYANRLANYLREFGVGPEVPIGLCMQRSPEMVVGALAILKAGGAYLPIDADTPSDRLAFMLNDANAPLLVCDRHVAAKLPSGPWKSISIDKNDKQIKRQSQNPPGQEITPKQAAYVIYTSGSTGQPKGVLITHEGLLNLIFWHQRAFEVTSADRASQVASLGFDAAVWEIWPYLAAGASVYFPDEAIRKDPEALRDWLIAQRITVSFAPTPLAERMIFLDWPGETALRFLLTGGDVLHHYLPPGRPFALVNNYGLTECTVVTTSGIVSSGEDQPPLPPLGRPIDNTNIYILDENMQQVAAGTPGHLFVGGVGVAAGYLNRPQLTRENFIPDPFSSEPGARLFKTGDLATFLPDGQLAFLGRADRQIKLRGYRIEPGEVEAHLNQHPLVRASAVVVCGDTEENKHLLAYIVPHSDDKPSSKSLREFLCARLPRCSVPSVFVGLSSFPITSNGKTDRNTLPAPNNENTLREEDFVAPRTDCEKWVAAVVGTLLGISEVGAEDNFFFLGGHSLLATQLISRVRNIFGVDLSLRRLFENPTIAGISQELERRICTDTDCSTD